MKPKILIMTIWLSFLSYGQTPGFEWAVATDGPGRCEANAVTKENKR